jgi:hypothetical protein
MASVPPFVHLQEEVLVDAADEQVVVFDNIEDYFAYMEKVRIEAEAATDPAHLANVLGEDLSGGWWVNVSSAMSANDLNLVIFCRVVGKEEFLAQGKDDPDVPPGYYESRWEDQCKTGFLLGECFSAVCPEGEWGDTHVTRLEFPIGGRVLEAIRQDRWQIIDGVGGLTTGGTLVRATAQKFDEE